MCTCVQEVRVIKQSSFSQFPKALFELKKTKQKNTEPEGLKLKGIKKRIVYSVKLAYLGSVVVVCERFHLLNQAESCFNPSLKSHMKHRSGDQRNYFLFGVFFGFKVAVFPLSF